MSRTTGSILVIAIVLLSGFWIWSKLWTTSLESQTAGIHAQMDQIAPDSTHKVPAFHRLKDAAGRARQQADDSKRLMDSLTREASGQ